MQLTESPYKWATTALGNGSFLPGYQIAANTTTVTQRNQILEADAEAKATGIRRKIVAARRQLVTWEVTNYSKTFELVEKTPHLDWLLIDEDWQRMKNVLPWNWSQLLPHNVWIGSVVREQADADAEVPYLLQIPAQVRFVLVDPLINTITLQHCQSAEGVKINAYNGDHGVKRPHEGRSAKHIHWVIIGGAVQGEKDECGEQYATNLSDVRALVEEAQQFSCPVFVSRLGHRPTWSNRNVDCLYCTQRDDSGDANGEDLCQWPIDLRLQQVPVVVNPYMPHTPGEGRLLDDFSPADVLEDLGAIAHRFGQEFNNAAF